MVTKKVIWTVITISRLNFNSIQIEGGVDFHYMEWLCIQKWSQWILTVAHVGKYFPDTDNISKRFKTWNKISEHILHGIFQVCVFTLTFLTQCHVILLPLLYFHCLFASSFVSWLGLYVCLFQIMLTYWSTSQSNVWLVCFFQYRNKLTTNCNFYIAWKLTGYQNIQRSFSHIP